MKKSNTKPSTFLPPQDVPTFGIPRSSRRGRRRGKDLPSSFVGGFARILFAGTVLKLVLPVIVTGIVVLAVWFKTPDMLQAALMKFLFAG